MAGQNHIVEANPPMAMLAELTHRCPLACPYCSNPLQLKEQSDELSTEDWTRVFQEAAAIGVLHVHFSGGEPASRRDLVQLVKAAADVDLYTNLITSGVGLNEKRMADLVEAGLEHVQLSIQGTTAEEADYIAGYIGGHSRKMDVANWVRSHDLPLTINAVCHRHNIEALEQTIQLSVDLGAQRLEVATVQFHGWAEKNKQALMPTRQQDERARKTVVAARERLKGVLVIDYVPADYHATYPKACMGGWGRVGLNVDPTGRVLPCHAAESIDWLSFDNVREKTLADIWYKGEAFNAFRGFDWMEEPCRSCDRKSVDFGGCRCQAMAMTGNAGATDPVCSKSPMHARLLDQIAEPDDPAQMSPSLIYRGR